MEVKYKLKYRQVKCPNCKHIFMWLYGPTEASYCLYRRKGVKEELLSTICPKCNLKMVVPDDALGGINIADEAIELFATVRGL